MPKLTEKQIIETFPLINSRELERKAGLRNRRLADVKTGKSSLTAEEIENIRKVLATIPR